MTSSRLAGLVGLAIGVASLACTRSDASLRDSDRVQLERIVTADERASKAMAEADRAQRAGNVIGALDAIDTQAEPAVASAAALLAPGATEPATEWGRSKREAWRLVVRARREQMGPYRAAVSASDPSKLMDALEAQARIERSAAAAIADLRSER